MPSLQNRLNFSKKSKSFLVSWFFWKLQKIMRRVRILIFSQIFADFVGWASRKSGDCCLSFISYLIIDQWSIFKKEMHSKPPSWRHFRSFPIWKPRIDRFSNRKWHANVTNAWLSLSNPHFSATILWLLAWLLHVISFEIGRGCWTFSTKFSWLLHVISFEIGCGCQKMQ